MSDEAPVTETLQSIADKIDRLANAMDARFDDLKSQLRVEIEAVRGDVRLVYDVLLAQQETNARNRADHDAFSTRLDDHDIRIVSLERRDQPR
jgi:hypothetical protein